MFRGFESRAGRLANLSARIVLGFGLLLSGYALVIAAPAVRLTYGATIASGVVTRQIESYRTGAPAPGVTQVERGPRVVSVIRIYRAVVSFQFGGKSYDVQSRIASDTPAYSTLSTVDVAFPRNRPDLARIRAEVPGFWEGAGLLLVGITIGAGAVRWWWRLSHGRATISSLPGGRSDVSGG